VNKEPALDMLPRYYLLKPQWQLRGWQDIPFALADTHSGQVMALDSAAFFAASICDGKTDCNSPFILDIHHSVCSNFLTSGVIEEITSPRSLQEHQKYRKALNSYHKALHWSITGRCNLKCRHCYLCAPDNKYSDLDFSQITQLVDQMSDAGIMEVSITGGEPFLRKDIWEILALFVEKRIRVTQIYTNGLLVSDSVLKRLQDVLAPQYERSNVKVEFSLSFDGVGCHDDIRGIEGTELKTLEAIDRIRNHGFPVKIETILYRKNINRMLDTLEVLKSKKVDYWKLSAVGNVGKWLETCDQENISPAEIFDCFLGLLKGFIGAERPMGILMGGFYTYNKSTGTEGALYGNAEGICDDDFLSNFSCTMSRFVRYLLPDGTLLPCISMTGTEVHDKMPNVLDNGLSEALQDPYLQEIVSITVKELLERNTACKTCEHIGRCNLGCRSSALTDNKDVFSVDPATCYYWKNGYPEKIKEMLDNCTEFR